MRYVPNGNEFVPFLKESLNVVKGEVKKFP